MPRPSEILPHLPNEGPPTPRKLTPRWPWNRQEQEASQSSNSDVWWSKLTQEQKDWTRSYLTSWIKGVKRITGLSDGELKHKFRIPK